MTPDIVIIGGGPVGLWTAIQLKKRLPVAEVLVYERHQQYQRSHVLKLNHWSLMLYAAVLNDPAEQQFFRDATGKGATLTRAQFTKSLYIRTNDFEDALLAYARNIGVVLEYRRIGGIEEAEALHPTCRLFIAADGARSTFRMELFGEDAIDARNLQHVVELKYDESVPSNLRRSPRLSPAKLLQVNQTLNHTMVEHVGRVRDGVVPVTLRMFLTAAEYAKLPEMSFKEPFTLGQPGLDPRLASDIESFVAARKAEHGGTAKGSPRLTKLELNMYSAKHYAVMRGNVGWFLVGDAALGVPYFRALNSGLMLGSRLGQIIAHTAYPAEGDMAVKVARYDKLHRPMHMATEFAIAKGKNAVLDSAKSLRMRLSKRRRSKTSTDVAVIKAQPKVRM